MSTLVFRTGSGSLQQVQIGAADLVAAHSAATSAWGWVGGFSGIRHILANTHNPFSKSTISNVFSCSGFRPSLCQILTFQGVVYLQDGYVDDAFGGDPPTQFLGLTICALAHECGAQQAIHVFMQCLAPAIFLQASKGIPGMREALYTQLNDNFQVILNEGATRGLPDQFVQAITALHLPHSYHTFRKFNQTPDDPHLAEISMIGGLLIWIGKQHEQSYLTRSAMVVRVAACLRSVGYKIGQIRTWDGNGDAPTPSRGVILVIAGSSDTDPYIMDSDTLEEKPFTSHYQTNTVGALLMNALHIRCDELPESFQTWYEMTQDLISDSLNFHWIWSAAHDHSTLKIISIWGSPKRRLPAWSVRLASLEFPNLADHLAPCYALIGSDETLRVVLKTKNHWASDALIPSELIRYRVITASILLTVIGKLAGPEFDVLRHATTLDLSKPAWITTIARCINDGMEHGFRVHTAVALIACIHCGVNPEDFENGFLTLDETKYSSSQVIGWRNGIYTVVPSLLFEMAPTKEAIGFRCSDKFIGNLPVHKEGFIKSGHERRMIFAEPGTGAARLTQDETNSHVPSSPVIDQPMAAASDVEMYINIERIFQTQEPDLCFCGRVGGEAIGVVGVIEILTTLLRSLEPEIKCSGHGTITQAEIMPASFWANMRWVRDRLMSKSMSSNNYHTYIPIKANRCWALFLAGHIDSSQGVLSYGCFDCAATKRSNAFEKEGNLIVIGYQ